MKKLILITIMFISLLFSANVCADNNVMKISMDKEVKLAKEIADGKGISFTLPEIETEDFFIYAVELAVFERHENESQWHIYTDIDGNESKRRYIEAPESLNFNVNFGDVSGYRNKAKYKIAYRYYIQNIYDTSKIVIAGRDIQDGWRLVGEPDSDAASADGFTFYKNTDPTMNIECFSYKYHSIEGLMINDCNPTDLINTYFPLDVFENGVTVQLCTNDYDREDILTVSYRLEDGMTGELINEANLPYDSKILTGYKTKLFKLYLTVSDNFGGSTTSGPYLFMIDTEPAKVIKEFYDGGYVLKGENLFSDFEITDDDNKVMTEGSVYAEIFTGELCVDAFWLDNIGNGVYRLDKTDMQDGEYTVCLKIYDKAYNESEHTFYQTLDNTAPRLHFMTPEENQQATYYSRWMNESRKIIVDANDDYSGIRACSVKMNSSANISEEYETILKEKRIVYDVTKEKTGKILYSVYVYDNAKEINKAANMYDESTGNCAYERKYVWLDKTKPTVIVNHADENWEEAPYTVTADFYDYSSSPSANDASGVKSKHYAITAASDEIPDWKVYSNRVTFTEGGVYYLHFKAVDNAGNENRESVTVRINSKAEIIGSVHPTEECEHTIYYSSREFFVVKNTAYNTKYHFELSDNDVSDVIKTTVRLESQDNRNIYGVSENVSFPTGNIERDIIFNMSYLDSDKNELPDGVYDMLITICEVKDGNEEIITHENIKACEIVIKRNAPPTPIINSLSGKVSITYPDEPLSGSLNNAIVKSRYKYEYKTVKDGEVSNGAYRNYTGEFDADDFMVVAVYTDIAGNTSITTKKIFADDSNDKENIDITEDGNNAVAEESRSADVYYIGVRREKQKGIKANIFGFMG